MKGTNYVKKDLIFMPALSLLLVMLLYINVNAASWINSDSKWYYRNDDNQYVTNLWMKINDYWYSFDSDGVMRTGWYKDVDSKWYFLDILNGNMLTGWVNTDGNWYYLDAASGGAMLSDTIVDGKYYLDSSGKWIEKKSVTRTSKGSSGSSGGSSGSSGGSSGSSGGSSSSSGGSSGSSSSNSNTSNIIDSAAYRAEVVRLVNAERKKLGLGELNISAELSAAADLRASEIVESFDHTRPNGSDPFTAAYDKGYANLATGENIAQGYRSPAEVVNGWMTSTGHRENILNPKAQEIGVGYCYKPDKLYRHYWVQLFGAKSLSGNSSDSSYNSVNVSENIDEAVYKTEVVRLVNIERKKLSLGELSISEELSAAADVRAAELIEVFSHIRPDGSIPFTAAEDKGYKNFTLGENIAQGYRSPAEVVDGWMNSPGHRQSMLNPKAQEIGVGYCYKPDESYKHYWVQLFGSKDSPNGSLTVTN